MAFTLDIPVRWGDLDQMGHLNNTVYFRFVEEARIQWMANLGLAVDGATQSPILASATVDFIAPAGYPCTMRVVQKIAKVGRSSVHLAADLIDADMGKLYARHSGVIVWFDYAANQSAPWPIALTVDAP